MCALRKLLTMVGDQWVTTISTAMNLTAHGSWSSPPFPRFQPLSETRALIGLSFDYGRIPMSNHCIHGNVLNRARLIKFTAVPRVYKKKHSQHKVFIGMAFNIQHETIFTVTGTRIKQVKFNTYTNTHKRSTMSYRGLIGKVDKGV